MKKVSEWFSTFARHVERWTGSPFAFILAILTVIVWASTGPLFNWSDSHSLFINTFTTVVTYLMIFCLQAAQTRDVTALQVKLDTLIAAIGPAHNELIAAEDLDPQSLDRMREAVRREARE